MRALAPFGVLLPLLALLTGCTAAPQAAPSTPTPTPTADLRPWASAIAEQSTQLEQIKSKLADEDCDAASSNQALCGAQFLTATIQAQTIALSVDSLTNTSAKDYISAPPHEIASLYTDTKTAADAAAEHGSEWSEKCIGSDSDGCLAKAVAFTSDLDDLSTQFTAWQPYS